MENKQVYYVFKNARTDQYVKTYSMGNDRGRSHLTIDCCDKPSEALQVKAVAYEPNHVRIAEVLTSLSDDIYQAKQYYKEKVDE